MNIDSVALMRWLEENQVPTWSASQNVGFYLATLPIPPELPRAKVGDMDGQLCCPECGSTEISATGHVPCWWTPDGQDPEDKTIGMYGWEWDASEMTDIQCYDCSTSITIPDDWEIVVN